MYNLSRFEVTPGRNQWNVSLVTVSFGITTLHLWEKKLPLQQVHRVFLLYFLVWEKNKTTTLKSMNQRKPRAIQKTLKILNPLFGQCLDTGFLINFFKAFCFDSAEVQKTMHNSYYPVCICQEHWQLGINLRFNWWCKLYTPKKGAYLDITPGRSLAISYRQCIVSQGVFLQN